MKKHNFRSAIAFALALFAASATDALAHSGNTIDGMLTWYDGIAHSSVPNVGKLTKHVITADDGHRIPLQIDASALPPGGWKAVLNKRVRVTSDPGVQSQNMDPGTNFVVKSMNVLAADDVLPTAGNRKYISLLCKWQGNALEPALPSYFETQLGNVYPGFDHYFQEVSYGLANITGSHAATAWVNMPHPESFYFPPGHARDGSYLHQMGQDCITAAESIVDFTPYVGINVMFNDIVDDCCAWGGSDVVTVEGTSKLLSMTWMPYWTGFGWLEQGVLAHELSHSFGSKHSEDPTGYQYGNDWDVVSHPGGTCIVVDPNYGCVGQHQVTYNKMSMGTIPLARIAVISAGSPATQFNIERMAQPAGAGGTFQAVQVTTGDPNVFYTIESRKRVGYDQNVPGDGVIIHKVTTTNVQPAHLVPQSGTSGGLTAMWTPGNSMADAANNVSITVNSYDVNGTATVTVSPGSTPGEYNFAVAGYSVLEGDTVALNVAVTRTAPFASGGSVTWSTGDGTAVAGTDFGTLGNTAQRNGTLTWAAGTGGTKFITVGPAASNIPIINDVGVQDGDKDFTISLSSPSGGVLGAQSTTTVTRQDTDSVIQFSAPTISVNEPGPNVVMTVTRTGSTIATQSVTFTTANGTALVGSDFGTTTAQVTGTITFNPGDTSQDFTIGPVAAASPYVRIINDTTIESPETFDINLTAPTLGATIGGNNKLTVTILSDENGVSLATASRVFNEGDGAQSLVVNRVGGNQSVDVNYSFTSGTAVNGVHFQGTNGSLHWNDGETGPKLVPVTILDDGVVNAPRTFSVSLSGVVGPALLTPIATTTVTINDNDNTVQFSLASTSVAESTPNLVLSVTRTGVTAGQSAQVTWTALDGSAFAGTDFGVNGDPTSPTGTLNWGVGDTASKTVTIPIINNATVQGARTFSVQLSAPTGPNLTIGANSDVAVTLNDDDKGVQFEFASYDVTEGVAPNTVTLRALRIGPSTAAATATWATVNGNGISGTDFGVLNSPAARTGTLSWAIGDVAPKTITIPILNNAIGGQPDRLFQVNLTPGAGMVLGTPGSATVTIHDDDIPPNTAVQFVQPKYVVSENVGSAVLSVQRVDLGGGFALASSVHFATLAGTAVATTDFTTTSGTLNWAAFDTANKQISVPIVNNTTAEPPKGFKVVLSGANPGTAVGAPGTATVLILDDDEVFPAHGVMPPGFSTPGGVTRGWHVSNDPGAFEGAFALRSDEIDDGESAGVQMSGTFLAGNVSFKVKISTEPTFDTLQFFIDGVPQTTWSGVSNAAWQASPMYPIGAGVHTLKWVYTKDASVSAGLDAVSLDGLVTPAFTP